MNLFTDAESANFGDGIVGRSSFNNIPFDVVGYVILYETPDISTESGPLLLLIHSVYVRVVLVYPGLQWVVCGTSVSLPVAGVSPGDSGFVDQVINHAANAREYLAGFRSFLGHA